MAKSGKPKFIVRAHCQYCGEMRQGAYNDVSDEYYDYYICEQEDVKGRRHVFGVLNTNGKNKQLQGQIINTAALTIIIYKGVEIYRERLASGVKASVEEALQHSAEGGNELVADALMETSSAVGIPDLDVIEVKGGIAKTVVKGIARIFDFF